MTKSFKLCLTFDMIATRAILVCGITGLCTSSILAFYVNKVVTKSLDFNISCVIASVACNVCIPSCFFASSILSIVCNFIVTKSLDFNIS